MPGIVIHADEAVHTAFGVLFGIERLKVWEAFRFPPLVGVFDVVFLDAGGVFEQDGGQLARGGSAEDLPVESIPDQLGYQPAVIDMRMGQDEEIHLRRGESPVTVEDVGLRAHALEHAAVEQVFAAVVQRDEVFGTGDGTGGAVKGYFHVRFFTLKDQVMKNSATGSPAALAPSERTFIVCASPVVRALSMASRIAGPSVQRNRVRPVAFLKYSASVRITSMDTGGRVLYRWAIASAPVLISAAMLRQAK